MTRRMVLAALVLTLAATTSCVSTPKDRSSISLRRANLSLAFTDPSLAEPAPLEVVQRIIPLPPAPSPASGPGPMPPVPVAPEVCPDTPDGAAPRDPAILKVARPREGRYVRVNEGSITLSSGTIELVLPYPPVTVFEVRNVRDVESENVAGVPAAGTTTWRHFEVFDELVPGVVSELIEYRYDDTRIDLVRREWTTAESGTAVFTPNPPVQVLALASPGTTWQSVGVDTEARLVRAVSGTVEGPARVDLCGQVVEAIPSTLEVQNANIGDVGVYGTEAGKPLVHHWLPQYGALLARLEVHTTEFARTADGVVRVDFDVISRLRSTEPLP